MLIFLFSAEEKKKLERKFLELNLFKLITR